MLRYLSKQMLVIPVWIQMVCLCGFGNTVCDGTCLCTINCINQLPVVSANAEPTDGSFRCLSIYQNKQRYTQVIFILIFFILWLKYRLFDFKDEDNIFYRRPQILANSSSSSGQSCYFFIFFIFSYNCLFSYPAYILTLLYFTPIIYYI